MTVATPNRSWLPALGGVTAAMTLLLTLPSCGPSKDPVVAVLDQLVDAARDRDGYAVAALLADDLDAGGQDKQEVLAMVGQSFAAYHALDVSYSNLEHVVKAGSARATFRLKMTGEPRNIGGLADMLPRSATYDVELTLREDKGHWLISQAKWSEAP